jgi:hypothetical protein
MTTAEYAEKWFIQNDIPVIKDGRSISIRNEEQDLELELSWQEVQYRAELYLEQELHRVKFNNE